MSTTMKLFLLIISFIPLSVIMEKPSYSQPMGYGTSYIQKYSVCPPGTTDQGTSCKVGTALKFKQWVPTKQPGNCPSGFRYIGYWYCVSN